MYVGLGLNLQLVQVRDENANIEHYQLPPLTQFEMRGGHDDPQNIFDHCAQTLRRRKLKLGDF